jgi:hypothetical protein
MSRRIFIDLKFSQKCQDDGDPVLGFSYYVEVDCAADNLNEHATLILIFQNSVMNMEAR